MSFDVDVAVTNWEEDSDFQAAEVTIKAQTTGQILVEAVYSVSVSVQVCLISPQGCRLAAIGVTVGTDQSEEIVPCSERTPHSDIPSAYVVRPPRGLSAFEPNDSSQCLHPL